MFRKELDLEALPAARGASAESGDSSAKLVLAVKLNAAIENLGLSQIEAANITGLTQPKVSQIRHFKVQNISLERLMQALVSLGHQVEIVVKPPRRTRVPSIKVAA